MRQSRVRGNPMSAVLGPTLAVINQLESEGFFKRYAIGGSVALMNYCEAFRTDDLDIYCFIPQETPLIDLAPIYKRLEELGHKTTEEYLSIEGVKVQFLPPHGELSEEAIKTAISVDVEGVTSRVFQYEYAIAMKAQAGRTKDWLHIQLALESAEPDMVKLKELLTRFGILAAWKRKFDV